VELIGEREYRLLLDKTTSGRPDKLWVNYTAPNVKFNLHPSPDAVYSLYFVSIKSFTEPTALTTDLLNTSLIPRHFYSALKWNLAAEIGPYFEKLPNEWMLRRAMVTKNQLINLNLANLLEPTRLEITGSRSDGNIFNPPA
jgi:hypothetical protein